MDVATVLGVARVQLVEFGETEFITDDELYGDLHSEDMRTLEAIARVNNPAYPLGDLCAQVDEMEGMRSPLALSGLGAVWLIRQMLAVYVDGAARPVHAVSPNRQGTVPPLWPAAYRERSTIHLIDGLVDSGSTSLSQRRYGWDDVTSLRIYYLERPAEITDSGDALGSPEDALQYLARYIAAKLAVRAKLEEIHLQIVQGRVEIARKELLKHVEEYGRTDA